MSSTNCLAVTICSRPFRTRVRADELPNRGVRHYAFTGRYDYTVDGDWTVQPAVMFRFTEITPIQLDLHAGPSIRGSIGPASASVGETPSCCPWAVFQDIRWATPMMPVQAASATSARTRTKSPYLTLPRRGAGFSSRGFGGRILDRNLIIRNFDPMIPLSLLVLIIASVARRGPNSSPRRRRSRQQRRRSRTHLPCLCPDGGRRGCHRCRLWRWAGLP